MMKKITLYISLVAAGIMVFAACKKEAERTADYELSTDKAFLRVIHASPNFRAVFSQPDSFNVWVNGGKINSPFLTFGSISPQSTTGDGYVAVTPGLQQIKLSVNGFASTAPDSTQLINFTKVFNTGQYYTLLVTDSIKNLKDSVQMFIRDSFPKPLPGNISLRFIHAVWNDTTGKTVDFFSYARNATIDKLGSKPGYIGAFSSYAVNPSIADTIYVTRAAPAGTPLSQRIVLAKGSFLPQAQRAYTIYFRGDANLTTGTKARSLAAYLHH